MSGDSFVWPPAAGSGTGSVTSVGLADSTGLFNVTGSPVTTSGTLTLASFQSQLANLVFAAPNGSPGAPTWRALVAADIPSSLGASTIAGITNSGSFSLASGNTVSVSSPTYSVAPGDYLLLVNTTSNAITITLPAPSARRMIIIKDVGGLFGTNNLTIARNGVEQIEGIAASLVLSANGGTYCLIPDGTNWWKAGAAKNYAFKAFATSGTYNVPAGVYSVTLMGRGGSPGGGGGGGGGGGSGTQAGGGGAGGSSGCPALSSTVGPLSVTPGAAITVTVGAGGSAGTGGSGATASVSGAVGVGGSTGGLGGATSFGTLWSWLGSNNGNGGGPGNVNAGAGAASSFAAQVTVAGPASGLGGAPGVSGGASGTGPRGVYMGQGGPSGSAGTNGGAGQGGGGGAGASASGGDFGGTFSTSGSGGNGGGAGAAGSNGTAASGTSSAGYSGAGGGGGGGGGVLAAVGTAGGAGQNGTAGSTGALTVSWFE